MQKFICSLILAFAGFGFTESIHADLVLDNYTNGLPLVQIGAGTATGTTVGGTIFGGVRNESLTVRSLGGLGLFGVASFGSGGVSVGQTAQDQIFGSFTYSNFSSTDFTINGFDRFRLRFNSTNAPTSVPGVISVTVTSGANTSTAFASLPALASVPDSGYVFFSQFSGVDFTSVDSVSFGFDFAGNPGGTFTMSGFALTAIPEPSSIGMAALLVGGVCCFRRRRRSPSRFAK